MCKKAIGKSKNNYKSVNLYYEDESRFGLFTKAGKSLTARAVKPVCRFQQVFQSLYLFGAFSPINGDHFLFTMPHCNSITFQEYLIEFSKHKKNEFKVIVLDNGAFHKAKSLKIPDNIALVFLPPYSPELNPAEKIWWAFKRDFSNQLFESLKQLEEYIAIQTKNLKKKSVKRTCCYKYIFSGKYWSNI